MFTSHLLHLISQESSLPPGINFMSLGSQVELFGEAIHLVKLAMTEKLDRFSSTDFFLSFLWSNQH